MAVAGGACTQKKFCWQPTSHPQSQLQTLVLYTLIELQTCTCEQDSSELLMYAIFPHVIIEVYKEIIACNSTSLHKNFHF